MFKVVDSNFLQSPELTEYLDTSSKHHVVLTDYAAMEAYKGNTLESIAKSMAILADYPNQVTVLKNTQIVCGLNGRGLGLRRRLIDERQTRGFGKYCRQLEAARQGDETFIRQLLEHGRDASEHLDRMLRDAASLSQTIEAIARTYSRDELRTLRTGLRLSEEMMEKFIKSVLLTAAFLFRDHPRVKELPSATTVRNAFIFRAALCVHLLAVDWISVGGAKGTGVERLRNDMVDTNFAAYATYFDGLLSADKKLMRIYREAVILLETVFASPRR